VSDVPGFSMPGMTSGPLGTGAADRVGETTMVLSGAHLEVVGVSAWLWNHEVLEGVSPATAMFDSPQDPRTANFVHGLFG
jgi:hypothetical protein